MSWKFYNLFLFDRLEKLRQKLEREVNLQKPKLEIVQNKKEELKNRLTQSMSKEADLSNSCDTLMQNVSNEDFQQLMRDAMRMKQLEVREAGTISKMK